MESVPPNPVSSLVPSMGPLHVDLNADEDIVINFLPFMNPYSPGRTRFLLEVTYGGWTLIRSAARSVFHQSKDLQYGTLLNLLDNDIPAHWPLKTSFLN